MKALIVGNWKLYVNSLTEGKKLLREIDKKLPRGLAADVVLCPPVPLTAVLKAAYGGRRMVFGAQDSFWEAAGAHTGQVSPESLNSLGIKYVILGHSEMRALGETNEAVAKKTAAALLNKLKPIVCVSEHERDPNGAHFSDLAKDIVASLARVNASDASRITVAYEPVWTIGGEEMLDPRVVHEAVIFIRKTLAELWGRESAFKVRIIYGGAVNTENVSALASAGGTSGVLVGHHSAVAAEFTKIIRAFS